ncbi:MAG: peptide-methionine (R)-S-oxide reductase MsrB [Cyclobacteriaceae bacterium]|nr:peptide-methionine (R)-S-oxide reductase MsrB [Cyclobacteriaceae bacterium]
MEIDWKKVVSFARQGSPPPAGKVTRTVAEWREQLTPEQYRVTREKGTERAFTGEHCTSFSPGRYGCTCCNTMLFDSSTKFESGTGWPSFTAPAAENALAYKEDNSLGMQRIEVLCNTCDAHLGHVFPDGPKPTGLRYCINSVSLVRVEE